MDNCTDNSSDDRMDNQMDNRMDNRMNNQMDNRMDNHFIYLHHLKIVYTTFANICKVKMSEFHSH